MPDVTYILRDGTERTVSLPHGETVMRGATGEDIPGIVGECGGFCNCGTCHVYVEPDWVSNLPPMTEQEDALLNEISAERRSNSRLGCQLPVDASLDGVVVRMPPEQGLR